MNAASPETNLLNPHEVCSIVVLYDGMATRTRALTACNYLVQQFWADIELKFHWWRTDFLRDATLAQVAADNAVGTDFLIMATESPWEVSPALESWFESWLSRRREREGALVDLRPAGADGSSRNDNERERFLREVCRRGNFDYLAAIPEGADAGNHSHHPTNGLSALWDDNLKESRPPSHYGLNE
jgi:hypothetical protein